MTEEQKITVTNIVRNTINLIAAKEYEKIADITTIASSWCNDDGTQVSAMKEFGEWLEGQLDMWAEDEGKEFVVDMFDEKNLEIMNAGRNNSFWVYHPTSHGKELDFWFEFDFRKNWRGKIISEFNVNI